MPGDIAVSELCKALVKVPKSRRCALFDEFSIETLYSLHAAFLRGDTPKDIRSELIWIFSRYGWEIESK